VLVRDLIVESYSVVHPGNQVHYVVEQQVVLVYLLLESLIDIRETIEERFPGQVMLLVRQVFRCVHQQIIIHISGSSQVEEVVYDLCAIRHWDALESVLVHQYVNQSSPGVNVVIDAIEAGLLPIHDEPIICRVYIYALGFRSQPSFGIEVHMLIKFEGSDYVKWYPIEFLIPTMILRRLGPFVHQEALLRWNAIEELILNLK